MLFVIIIFVFIIFLSVLNRYIALNFFIRHQKFAINQILQKFDNNKISKIDMIVQIENALLKLMNNKLKFGGASNNANLDLTSSFISNLYNPFYEKLKNDGYDEFRKLWDSQNLRYTAKSNIIKAFDKDNNLILEKIHPRSLYLFCNNTFHLKKFTINDSNIKLLELEGSVVKGKLNGLVKTYYTGRYQLECKLKSEGYYLNGEKNGLYKEFWPSGNLKEQRYYSGNKLVGINGITEWKTFYDRAQLLESEIIFNKQNKTPILKNLYHKNEAKAGFTEFSENGLKNGKLERYCAHGNIKAKGNYLNGKKNGLWKIYWDRSEKLDIKKYGFDGGLKKIIEYSQGEYNGQVKGYYDNGQLQYEGELYFASKSGSLIYYDENGKITSEEEVKSSHKVWIK